MYLAISDGDGVCSKTLFNLRSHIAEYYDCYSRDDLKAYNFKFYKIDIKKLELIKVELCREEVSNICIKDSFKEVK